MFLISRCDEWLPESKRNLVPRWTRGVYVLFKKRRGGGKKGRFDVVYVGMSSTSIRNRLRTHARNKKGLWDHFSVFEVHMNISEDMVKELEGLLRHIYSLDTHANELNMAKSFKAFKEISAPLENWSQAGVPFHT
ncbi:MAG: GIY-YIG nuclease family protein [Thaumarchaeota archaeon]|nr:GIY-YIG nuclease family protein [Nitrososphaerota archaeon]